MTRETKSAMLADAPPHTAAKLIDPNTIKYTAANGDTVWRLHHTDIVTKHTDGTWTLDSGGWKTVTTKDRMNRYAPCGIGQRSGIWYIGAIPYYDGIKLSADGVPIANGHDSPAKVETDTRALKRKVAKFVKLVDTCDKLPLPETGDCWLCCMQDKAGNTMGSMIGRDSDAEHLMDHVHEGYLHGSLLVNAMRAKGYRDEQIRIHYGMDWRDGFKRALRRYLLRAFGLAVN